MLYEAKATAVKYVDCNCSKFSAEVMDAFVIGLTLQQIHRCHIIGKTRCTFKNRNKADEELQRGTTGMPTAYLKFPHRPAKHIRLINRRKTMAENSLSQEMSKRIVCHFWSIFSCLDFLKLII